MNRNISLRRKLFLWLFPVLILFVIGAVFSYYTARKFADRAYDRSLADSARDLERQVTVVNGKASVDLPAPARKMLLTDEFDKIYYQVKGPDGGLIDGDPDLPAPDVIGRSDAPIIRNGFLHGHRLRIASRYYMPPGSRTGRPVLVQLAETLNKRKIMVTEILIAVVLPQLALITTVVLFIWLGVGKGLGPMLRLRDAISTRSYHDLSPLKEDNAPKEVRSIIRAVNDLMGRLEKAISAQQSFFADATHQLRTPMAGLITQIELLAGRTDKENLHHSVEMLNISARRVVRLINQMLNLAMVGPDANKNLELKRVNLTNLVRKTTMEWVPLALKKDIDLGMEGPEEEIPIQGDALHIKLLLDNLIDNAVRYSPRGSVCTVRLEKSGDIILSVEDNGPGIPPEERDKVFQRFYRMFPSDAEGCGIGLSIAKEIAGSHGAAIIIDNPRTHKGTLVKIVFPGKSFS